MTGQRQRVVLGVIAWGLSMYAAYRFGVHVGIHEALTCIDSLGTVCP